MATVAPLTPNEKGTILYNPSLAGLHVDNCKFRRVDGSRISEQERGGNQSDRVEGGCIPPAQPG